MTREMSPWSTSLANCTSKVASKAASKVASKESKEK
jgi:hypothetical protein